MKKIISSTNAPAAIGPYSQAVQAPPGNLLYLSGQIPLDPKSMAIVGETAAEQCQQVMVNIGELLKEAGGDYSNIIKINIWLVDMGEFAAVNEVYGRFFESDPPARACVEVSRLPKDVRIEIEAIAMI